MLTEQAQKFFYARKRDRKGLPAIFWEIPQRLRRLVVTKNNAPDTPTYCAQTLGITTICSVRGYVLETPNCVYAPKGLKVLKLLDLYT